MSLELANSTAVIVARHFNPSIIRDHWLITNGIMSDGDLRPGSVFSDMICQARTERFNLLITPDQCQFAPLVEADQEQEQIQEKVGVIIDRLPHTPFFAMGLNFTWHFTPNNETIEQATRRLFFASGNPIHKRLDIDGAKFGSYVSADVLGFRLKIESRPMVTKEEDKETHFILLKFNFHLDLLGTQEEKLNSINKALAKWNDVKYEAVALGNSIDGGNGND